jgi:hypothetical protein
VASDHFGQTFHDDIRPQFQRPGQYWRGECVVHHKARTGFAAALGQGGNIDHAQQRVGHRLDKENACFFGQRAGHGVGVMAIDELGLHAEASQLLIQKLHRSAIKTIAGHDALPLLHCCQQDGANRRHAGAANYAPAGAFQPRQTFCQ